MGNEDKWLNPVEGIITSSFGERVNPILGSDEFHTGLDIAVPVGTEVMAVRGGAIKTIGHSDTYGNYVKYVTENGYEVFYAHLDRCLLSEGDSFNQGDIIALSGNTGLSTGAHLHYGISIKGELIDPMDYVELKYTEEVIKEYKARGEVIN